MVGEDFRFGNPKDSASAYDLDSMFRLRGAQCRVEIEKAIVKASSEGKSLTNYSLKKSDISSIEIHLIINTIIAELKKAGYCTHTTDYCKNIVIDIIWYE